MLAIGRLARRTVGRLASYWEGLGNAVRRSRGCVQDSRVDQRPPSRAAQGTRGSMAPRPGEPGVQAGNVPGPPPGEVVGLREPTSCRAVVSLGAGWVSRSSGKGMGIGHDFRRGAVSRAWPRALKTTPGNSYASDLAYIERRGAAPGSPPVSTPTHFSERIRTAGKVSAGQVHKRGRPQPALRTASTS